MSLWKRLFRRVKSDPPPLGSPATKSESASERSPVNAGSGQGAIVEALLKDYGSADQESSTRAFSQLTSLAQSRDSGLVEPLQRALQHPAGRVRSFAASLLGSIGDKRSASALIPLLEDTVWDVRYRAVESLGKLEVRDAILPIIKCVGKERNFRVRGRGLHVLEHVFHCTDDRIVGHVQALWRENRIDPHDRESGFDEVDVRATPTRTQPKSSGQGAASDYQSDPFIATCLEVEYQERKDDRWFSHFKELPQIDALRKDGRKEEALSLCRKGLEQYSDSFLFYIRAADLCDELKRPEQAEQLLREGLSQSLSKCSIAGALADRAFAKGTHRDAIRWWITAGVLQLESKIMVDAMPFLNLAYVCQPIGIGDAERWLLAMADRSSSQGPIRFNAEGADLRHQVARSAMAAGDDAAQHAIVAFHERYK